MAQTFRSMAIQIVRTAMTSSDYYTGISDGADSPSNVQFIGTVFYLDPCGRYHHFLSPNNMSKRCERFWEALDQAATDCGSWLESGDGDPCDQYIRWPATIDDISNIDPSDMTGSDWNTLARWFDDKGHDRTIMNRVMYQYPQCDRCAAATIQGVFCHESGCSNAHKEWDTDEGEWIDPIDDTDDLDPFIG